MWGGESKVAGKSSPRLTFTRQRFTLIPFTLGLALAILPNLRPLSFVLLFFYFFFSIRIYRARRVGESEMRQDEIFLRGKRCISGTPRRMGDPRKI